MKNILNSVLALCLLVAAGCDKEKQTATELEGKWELIEVKGSVSNADSEVPAGSGIFLSFNDGTYERSVNFKVVESGSFSISKNEAEVDGVKYSHEIKFSSDESNSIGQILHVKVSNDRLTLSAGAIADNKATATYKKI